MANTRNSQKKENDEAGAPVAADSKDSSNDEPTMSDLVNLIQAQGETLKSELGETLKSELQTTLQSELRSIRADFESTSEQNEEALFSFSTRLDRIENQLAEQNMQHDNNRNINGSNVRILVTNPTADSMVFRFQRVTIDA